MRILHCSDFHGNRRWFDWLVDQSAKYHLVCLTGDLLDLFEIHRVNDQLRMIKAALSRVTAPLAICSGNHDSFSGPPAPPSLLHADWLNELRRPGVWIDGEQFELAGHRFRCVGWNAPLPPAASDEIWLSHAPPARSSTAVGIDDSEAGDELLREICRDEEGPGIVLSGHQHNPQRWACRMGNTFCFNPGFTRSAEVPNHIVIDTMGRLAVLHTSQGSPTAFSLNPVKGHS